MTDHKMTASPCPFCAAPLDMASGVTGDTAPEPGDASVCLQCGNWLRYADDLSLRKPTDEEYAEMAGNKNLIAASNARLAAVREAPEGGDVAEGMMALENMMRAIYEAGPDGKIDLGLVNQNGHVYVAVDVVDRGLFAVNAQGARLLAESMIEVKGAIKNPWFLSTIEDLSTKLTAYAFRADRENNDGS